MKIDIYGDGISFVTNEVSTVKTNKANLSEKNRIKFVTDLAAVSRGKSESNNPELRYKQLLKEAALNTPSRPLEFLPVVVDICNDDGSFSVLETFNDGSYDPIYEFKSLAEANKLLKYSYLEPAGDRLNYRCYTNMRALLNAGVPYDKIPYNSKEELKEFRALKAKIPMFVWGQVPNTHTAISKEAQSDRVATEEDYWLPNDFFKRCTEYYSERTTKSNKLSTSKVNNLMYYNISKEIINKPNRAINFLINGNILSSYGQGIIQGFFKELGYTKEIYQRAMYYFKYKVVVMTGWLNDTSVWKHLFIERGAEPKLWRNWTQKETKQFVEAIKKIVEG